MAIVEMEKWRNDPERPGVMVFDSQRAASEVFADLEKHLKADGRVPDEYLLFDEYRWGGGKLFPRDATVISDVDYGGSEGVYIDIFIKYVKEVPTYNEAIGKSEPVKQNVIEHFATGKTLGDRIEDLDKMNLVASSVTAAFFGMEREVKARYAKIESGEIQAVYPVTRAEKPKTLEEKLNAAKEMSKARDTQGVKDKSHKLEERV